MYIFRIMSFLRAKRRAVNNNVYLDNRLTMFTNPPMKQGNLNVEKNETVGQDLDVCGNLTIGGNLRATNFYASGNYFLDNYILIPFGTIIQSAAVNEPTGWMDCNGRTLAKSAYLDLFNAIGYAYSGIVYNGVDPSFNIPDFRGRVGVGAGTGAGLTARDLGALDGEEAHILTEFELPPHRHTITRRSNPDDGAYDTSNNHYNESSAATTDREVLGTFTTGSTGSNYPHNNMQPFVVIRYFIKY